jgi:hypothetical protein
MKKYLIFVLFLVSFRSYSQDTTDFSINPKWVNPEINEIKKDSILVNEKVLESKSIIGDIIEKIISDFDLLYDEIPFGFPHHIKKKVINKYGNVKILPNSLAIECPTPKNSIVDTVILNPLSPNKSYC